MRPYQYRCNDYSLLTPFFKKWIITPLIPVIPWAIPANIITIISNCFVYLALYLCVFGDLQQAGTPVVIASCLLLYLIGDHLDGMQAKRTGTGSALGEFCDHYLDAFNNGIIVYTMFRVFNIDNGVMIAGVIAISYLAHMSVFYEQFKTGWLTFEKIGSLEGVLISAILIGLCAVPDYREFMIHPFFAGYTIAEIFILLSTAGALATFIQTWKRTPDVQNGYWLFAVMMLALGMVLPFFTSPFQTFTVLTLYASLYIGKLMIGHLIDGKERNTDMLVPLFIAINFFTAGTGQSYLFGVLFGYLLARIFILIANAFSTLGIYWVWSNSRT